MKTSLKIQLQSISSIMGSCLTFLFIGLPWYYGNMSVYLWSYLVIRKGVTSDIYTPWIVSAFHIGGPVGLVLAGRLKKAFGKRVILLCGLIISNGGYYASYFAIDQSVWLLVLSLGLCSGIGMGFVNGMSVDCANDWAGEHLGLVTSIVLTANIVGSAIINLVLTYLANPDNLQPNMDYAGFKFLNHDEVLDRVPGMILKVSIIISVFNICGFCMIRAKNDKETESRTNILDKNRRVEQGQTEYETIEVKDIIGNKEQGQTKYETNEIKADGIKIQGQRTKYETMDVNDFGIEGQGSQQDNNSPNASNNDNRQITPGSNGVSPGQSHQFNILEIIKTCNFLSLWYTLCCGGLTFLVFSSFFKTFGLIYINDDHFLADLGSIIMIPAVVLRILYGLFTESFKAKTGIIIIFVVVTALGMFMYLSPSVNEYLYSAIVMWFVSVSGLIYTSHPVAVVKLYGQDNFSTYYGVVMTADVVQSMIAPFLINAILGHWGWLGLFTTMAGINFTALLVAIFGLTHDV